MYTGNYDPVAYNQHFSKNCQQIKAGPLSDQERSCNDKCCVGTFFLIILTILVLGAIMINDGKTYFQTTYRSSSNSVQISGFASSFSNKGGGIIIGMFALSIILSIIFLLLLKNFPKCMVYSMIILIYLVNAALIVFGVIKGIWWLVIVCAVIILVMTCILFCFRQHLKTGLVILQISSTFLSEKPSVYAAPLYPLFFSLIFFIYWIVAMVGQSYFIDMQTNKNQDTSKQKAFIVVYIIAFIFMGQFFSYVQTYMISTCCGYWYYGVHQNYYVRGAKTMNRFHLGSMTFGALVITILKVLQALAKQQQRAQAQEGNICMSVVFCLINCCLTCIKQLVQTLNYNAIIVMSVTGQSFLDSAKTAFSIIVQNFGLYNIVSFISGLITFFGILICVGIPTLVGLLLFMYELKADTYNASYGAIAIFFLSILISGFIISLLCQALGCIFIFFCFDKKFHEMGITVPNSPPVIRQFITYGDIYTNRPQTDMQLRQNKPF